jgi:hypothetical protein
VTPDESLVIEFFGEGKTDVGTGGQPTPPTTGVVPILVHRLCDRPPTMVAKRRPFAFLQGKNLAQKVRFARRQAYYNRSAGAVFVMDSEGDERRRRAVQDEMAKGREQDQLTLPMAIGVAQPCIEAWLLVDEQVIRRVAGIEGSLALPAEPELLPAPCRSKTANPKAVLAGWGIRAAAQKDAIAAALNDIELLETRCPAGFGTFAQDVRDQIKPLFSTR